MSNTYLPSSFNPQRADGVLVVGAVLIDELCEVPHLPRSGEGVVVQRREHKLGGCAFNSANIAKQLDARVRLFAPIGTGPCADFAASELAARDLAALPVATQLDCGSCMCLVEPSGERTMITTPGIERCFEKEWFSTLSAVERAGFGCGLVSGYEIAGAGGEAIIGFFEQNPHIGMFYAPGPCIMSVGVEALSRIDALRPVWHLNADEARAFTGSEDLEQAARVIAKRGAAAVVITDGAQGSYALVEDEFIYAAPVSVKVVDTVGAGDAHLGALAASLMAGALVQEALAFANAAAAAVCAVAGGSLSNEEFATYCARRDWNACP